MTETASTGERGALPARPARRFPRNWLGLLPFFLFSFLFMILPTSYLMIHRTWLGGLGLLSQLEAEAPFRSLMVDHLPGFAD